MPRRSEPNVAKGWFQIPGIREQGDRTIEEQAIGLAPALEEAKGKTVLDVGCAEGAISRLFAEAGAAEVVGIESLAEHLAVARKWCKGFPQIRFENFHLQDWMTAHPEPEVYDVVLILGIVHKIDDPAWPIRWACRSCRNLLLFRGPADGNRKMIVTSKWGKAACHWPTEMAAQGFALERRIPGVRGEGVEYWRRKR